eukprot:TRINITY_DN28353_c0_g1_i1.p1 TRINITY_DN28353_c0_g1~~TRINITY_DN28353_c0_g1_i1.p1  ORF type:complete len:269 (-),score=77.97 TRINITY_DN28353_c0_g1_i1:62-796(-)
MELLRQDKGVRLALWDIDQTGLSKLKSDLLAEDATTKAEEYLVDISDVEQVRKAAKKVEEDLGPIHCLVNNAGRINRVPFLMKNGSTEEWMKIVNVNIVGTLNVTSTIFPLMAARKAGHVVNISSIMGIAGAVNYAVYSASKHFIEGFSKSIRKEGLLDGVKVTVIRPGPVDTNFAQKSEVGGGDLDQQAEKVQREIFGQMLSHGLPWNLNAAEIGKSVAYAINLPHHVAVNEINISAIGFPEM